MPYSWEGLSRLRQQDSYASLFHPDQEVKHWSDQDRFAFGVLRDTSLYVDGSDRDAAERLLSTVDTSELSEILYSRLWLQSLATQIVRPSRIDSWVNFIVPNPKQAKTMGRLLAKADRDAVMRHRIPPPADRVAELMKDQFEKQLQGFQARVFGIVKDDLLVSWLRCSPANGKFWKVDMMWTLEEHRKRGYCTDLILAAVNHLLEEGIIVLITDVDIENHAALSACKSVQSLVYANLTILQA